MAISAFMINWLGGILLTLTLWGITTPTGAALSDKAGVIYGTPPTGSVFLQAVQPDGSTGVINNGFLAMTLIPNQFSGLLDLGRTELQDADGDRPFSVMLDDASITLTWAHDGKPLTPTQLAAPLGNNFAGKKLELVVSGLVTLSTLTGLPTTAAPFSVTTLITVQVDAPDALSLSLDSDSAYVEGGSIMMTAIASKAGVPMPGAVISFATTGAVDRQGNTGGWTGSNDPLQLSAASIGSKTFTTGANGQIIIPVTHPGGLGVKTTVTASSGVSATTDVTFAIVTSPDTPLANMYGHMPETLTGGGYTFRRPFLEKEQPGGEVVLDRGEKWALFSYNRAREVCGNKFPTPSEARLWRAEYPKIELRQIGWSGPVVYRYRTWLESGDNPTSSSLWDESVTPEAVSTSYSMESEVSLFCHL